MSEGKPNEVPQRAPNAQQQPAANNTQPDQPAATNPQAEQLTATIPRAEIEQPAATNTQPDRTAATNPQTGQPAATIPQRDPPAGDGTSKSDFNEPQDGRSGASQDGQRDEQHYEQQDGLLEQQQDGLLDEQQDGLQDEQQDGLLDEQRDGLLDELQDGPQGEQQDGLQDGLQDEQQDGLQNEQQDGLQDEQQDGLLRPRQQQGVRQRRRQDCELIESVTVREFCKIIIGLKNENRFYFYIGATEQTDIRDPPYPRKPAITNRIQRKNLNPRPFRMYYSRTKDANFSKNDLFEELFLQFDIKCLNAFDTHVYNFIYAYVYRKNEQEDNPSTAGNK